MTAPIERLRYSVSSLDNLSTHLILFVGFSGRAMKKRGVFDSLRLIA